MKLEDTRISIGGIFRCCVGTVAQEYEGKEVQLGYTSSCKFCKNKFVLRDVGKEHPFWVEEETEA